MIKWVLRDILKCEKCSAEIAKCKKELDTPGLLHHVMIRGIERRKIFKDDKDRENFIERLSILLPETKTKS